MSATRNKKEKHYHSVYCKQFVEKYNEGNRKIRVELKLKNINMNWRALI